MERFIPIVNRERLVNILKDLLILENKDAKKKSQKEKSAHKKLSV